MSGVNILIENRTRHQIDDELVRLLAGRVLGKLDIARGELGVTFINDSEMIELNRKHMGRKRPTDVLAFPIEAGAGPEAAAAGEAGEDTGVPVLLGDIVICPDVAKHQASLEGTTFEQELCLLMIHGILHISGADHEVDDGAMDALQNRLYNELCHGD
jgi:probable rRNA maturation factor